MVRLKKRYLVAEIEFKDGLVDTSITSHILLDKIRNAVQEAHGVYGLACVITSLKVKYLNPYTRIVFIGCNRDYYRMVWSALTFVKNLKNRSCCIRVLHVGGTLRSCQKVLIKYNKAQLSELLQQCKTPAHRERVSQSIKQAEDETTLLNPFKNAKRRKEHQQERKKEKI